jgi:hypothetical protein
MKKYTGYYVIDETCYKLQMYARASKISILSYIASVFTKCLLIALKLTFLCGDTGVSYSKGYNPLKEGNTLRYTKQCKNIFFTMLRPSINSGVTIRGFLG